MSTREQPAAAGGIVVEDGGLGIACDPPEWVVVGEPCEFGVAVAGARRVPLLEVKIAVRGGEALEVEVHPPEARGDRAHLFRAVLPPLADGDVAELTLRARDGDREVVAPADGSGSARRARRALASRSAGGLGGHGLGLCTPRAVAGGA